MNSEFKSKCCGIDGLGDYDTTKQWDKKVSYTYGAVTYSTDMVAPVTCCRFKGEFPSGDMYLLDLNCPMSPTATNSYKYKVSRGTRHYKHIMYKISKASENTML